jgi:hypothetical protein
MADPSTDGTTTHRALVFAPDRPERCDYFLVTEFTTSFTGAKPGDAFDSFLYTDAIGVMRNVDRSRAVGASIDVHLANGAVRLAPTLRFKQWLKGRGSVDLLVGYAPSTIEQEGVTGVIVDVRYSPAVWCHVQAGACRIRDVSSIFYYPEFRVEEDTRLRLHAGVGLGGVPGVASWGVQAVGFALLAAAFAESY